MGSSLPGPSLHLRQKQDPWVAIEKKNLLLAFSAAFQAIPLGSRTRVLCSPATPEENFRRISCAKMLFSTFPFFCCNSHRTEKLVHKVCLFKVTCSIFIVSVKCRREAAFLQHSMRSRGSVVQRGKLCLGFICKGAVVWRIGLYRKQDEPGLDLSSVCPGSCPIFPSSQQPLIFCGDWPTPLL